MSECLCVREREREWGEEGRERKRERIYHKYKIHKCPWHFSQNFGWKRMVNMLLENGKDVINHYAYQLVLVHYVLATLQSRQYLLLVATILKSASSHDGLSCTIAVLTLSNWSEGERMQAKEQWAWQRYQRGRLSELAR